MIVMNDSPVTERISSVTGCRLAVGSGDASARAVEGASAMLTATEVTCSRAARTPSSRASSRARAAAATTITTTTANCSATA
ncbi:Uncharacterised protein [Mycobacteroides abscessus subsp. abscessus]|nr:Uncharacterised protein [Mycobacteroides abscessus subsp. abscessus]